MTDLGDPSAAVAAMTAAIFAEIGEPLAAAGSCKPQLFINDLLSDPGGTVRMLAPAQEQQLVVITGLLQVGDACEG
jgi:hypothetical protein